MTPPRNHSGSARVFVAIPLLCALLAASILLWSRADPSRQGGFCTNATAELEGLALVMQEEPERMQDLQWVLNELVERVDVKRISATVPDDLREEVELLVELDSEHDRAVEVAVDSGAEPPSPSPELVRLFGVFMLRYVDDCVSTSVAEGIVDQLPPADPRPPGGQ